ncbi:CD109 antigen-like [Pelmatolapia mariae]|uniref:CD109 antigen-like n=1 Tax=Pelmatolapia mariae TaxID=158779 RepID=UPI003211DB83
MMLVSPQAKPPGALAGGQEEELGHSGTGPEVVHAGTPTPLAVTVFADFPGTVTAELGRGSTKVSLTEDFQEGLTSVLTLPPIPDSLTQNSVLNLTVRGYKGNSVIFTNTTTLTFSPRNVSTFIQTDRSRYYPGDTVKVRAMCVQLDNRPYKDRVDLSVRDPSGNIVDRWESTANLGIVLREFHLSQTAPLGRWVIAATVNGATDEKQFVVELYGNVHINLFQYNRDGLCSIGQFESF